MALDTVREETPYRVFSVRTFNDSKAFEPLKAALATLARRHGPGWGELTPEEALRELGLTPNPTHVFLYGPWRLIDAGGQVVIAGRLLSCRGRAVGDDRGSAACGDRHGAAVQRVVCVENLASFYELIRYEGEGLAALCLWGNPAPPVRHLLARLAETLAGRDPAPGLGRPGLRRAEHPGATPQVDLPRGSSPTAWTWQRWRRTPAGPGR